jgi:hypothetical protein
LSGRNQKENDKKTKVFYDWATTGIPVIRLKVKVIKDKTLVFTPRITEKCMAGE